jgi:hypothetical protein
MMSGIIHADIRVHYASRTTMRRGVLHAAVGMRISLGTQEVDSMPSITRFQMNAQNRLMAGIQVIIFSSIMNGPLKTYATIMMMTAI